MPNGTNTYHFDSLLFYPFRQPQYKDDGEKDGMDMKSQVDESTRINSMRLEWNGGVGVVAVMLSTISFL